MFSSFIRRKYSAWVCTWLFRNLIKTFEYMNQRKENPDKNVEKNTITIDAGTLTAIVFFLLLVPLILAGFLSQ